MRIQDISSFSAVKEAGLAKLLPNRPRIAVGMGTCGNGNGACRSAVLGSSCVIGGSDVAVALAGAVVACCELGPSW